MDSGVTIYNYMDTFYCCKVEKDKFCEEAVTDHMLVYLISGEMELIGPDKRYKLKKGDAFLVRRNHLIKKIKQPAKNGEPFKGLFLFLKMPFLKNMLHNQQVQVPAMPQAARSNNPYVMLDKHPFLTALFTSLEQYFDAQQYPSEALMNAKLQEAVYTLLQLKPSIAPLLFDFAEPWKVNLEEFMQKNYNSDLTLEEFAHYTGRSLSTFKKDFDGIFHITPSRWIVKRRLQEARSLMESTGAKASEIYLKVGFKNLSHFSTAFKREYGVSPQAFAMAGA